MKKKVIAFCRKWGYETAYSGNTRTLYIKCPDIYDDYIETAIIDEFGYGLPFKIETQH